MVTYIHTQINVYSKCPDGSCSGKAARSVLCTPLQSPLGVLGFLYPPFLSCSSAYLACSLPQRTTSNTIQPGIPKTLESSGIIVSSEPHIGTHANQKQLINTEDFFFRLRPQGATSSVVPVTISTTRHCKRLKIIVTIISYSPKHGLVSCSVALVSFCGSLYFC